MNMDSSGDEFEEELEEIAAAAIITAHKERAVWVHEVNKGRETFGEFHTLINILEKEGNAERFYMYFRMSRGQFEELHTLIKDKITKMETNFRKAIGSKERLAVCLRFLATGNSFRSLGFSYKMGFSTVREIVNNVCTAIIDVLMPIVLPQPTESLWLQVAHSFSTIWNFPNCIGALDGKHVNIKCPINSGSNFYNYKGTYSVVLLALVDPHYKFIAIDVGSYGKNSDGGILSKSNLEKLLTTNSLNIPGEASLIEGGEKLPFVIVGDEAFPLKSYLLRPYSRQNLFQNEPAKIFNYRLSRARRVVENDFGILANRWRIFLKPMEVQPPMADKIITTAICLHNMLTTCNYDIVDYTDITTPEPCFTHVQSLRQNCTQQATYVRDKFCNYFVSTNGSVPWQLDKIRTKI